ncbi:MAG TPA: hypothetical protein EYG70_01015 [Sulfurimonas sp.]|nr:hypothetical protein [Sulfurimonas sp.]
MKYLPKRILQATMLASGLLLLNACGGGGGSTAPDTNTTTPEATSITHNGTTYGFVTSPHTGKVWLDKNLGAAEICAGFDDSQCYGDYYQWGRDYDGHQDKDSGTSTQQSSNVTDVRHANFIKANGIYSHDWAKATDASGSRRMLNWSKIDGSSVCPAGFRVPSIDEFKAETLDKGVSNRATAFTNFLKLPSSGSRAGFDGSMYSVGSTALVWSSTAVSSNSFGVFFRSSSGGVHSGSRADGFSVRCLKN